MRFLGMIEVFVSSEPNSIAMGVRWLDSITYGLKNCIIEIVIASPISVIRPWINFEAGAGWVRDIPVIPLCHSGISPSTLPAPLNSLQAAMSTNATDLERVLAVLAKGIDCKMPEVDYTPFIKVVTDFQETSKQIRMISDKSPVAEEGGLTQHEFVTLAAIAEEAYTPTSPVWPHTVRQYMNAAGYRNVAATLGMAGLDRKGLIESFEEPTNTFDNEIGIAIRITPNGWAWLEMNVDRIDLQIPPSEPEPAKDITIDEIPF